MRSALYRADQAADSCSGGLPLRSSCSLVGARPGRASAAWVTPLPGVWTGEDNPGELTHGGHVTP